MLSHVPDSAQPSFRLASSSLFLTSTLLTRLSHCLVANTYRKVLLKVQV
jgi:hypothetical protein